MAKKEIKTTTVIHLFESDFILLKSHLKSWGAYFSEEGRKQYIKMNWQDMQNAIENFINELEVVAEV